MKIYTKRGDDGTTFDGKKRVPKYDCSMDGQGEIDELNAWIGIVSKVAGRRSEDLKEVQTTLFNIGGQLATRKILLKQEDITFLEEKIDAMNALLPELKNFVYPNNTTHIARAVCRRAERVLSAWQEKSEEPEKFEFVIPYLNRLSDYLFVLARNQSESDKLWVTDRNDH